MDKWTKLATQEVIEKTIKSLKANGISAEVIDSGKEALKRALELIPEGAEVMNTSSRTVDSIGLAKEINESAKFKSVKNYTQAIEAIPSPARRRMIVTP